MGYSGLSLLGHAALGNRRWPTALPVRDMARSYDIVIVGGGGHGLATAHYLAARHGIRNVAVIEAGWIGGGNTGRNTTIVRSDYLLEASFGQKNMALGLWRDLSRDLNFNIMYEPRGYVDLAHSEGELEHFTLRANAMRLRGAEAAILDRSALATRVPQLDLSGPQRFPITGALLQEAGGVVRHDAVAWGFARRAASAGVDVFQNCPATGFRIRGNRVLGVETPKGFIACDQVLLSVAGSSAQVTRLAGIDLPLSAINVQACVTEPVKPALDAVVNYNAGLCYVSQTSKGEFVLGGATDGYPSSARRGSFDRLEDILARAVQMFPFLSRLRLMRHWSGTADIPTDGNAIMGRTPLKGLWLNAGWGYAGFKATPAVGYLMAEAMAESRVPALMAPFALERFAAGAEQDDGGIGPYPWLH